jgi:hypothetical protein
MTNTSRKYRGWIKKLLGYGKGQNGILCKECGGSTGDVLVHVYGEMGDAMLGTDDDQRSYVKLSQLKVGTFIEYDGLSTCIIRNTKCCVFKDAKGFFVVCSEGVHRLKPYEGEVIGFFPVEV